MGNQQENRNLKEHMCNKEDNLLLKMREKLNSTTTRIWDPTLSQLSEIMALSGRIKVKQ